MEREQALQRIKTVGSTFIKTPAIKVKRWQNLDRLLADMNDVADHAQAAGLCANQIGVKSRVILLCIDKKQFIINPEIVERSSETELEWEGCLSLPGYKARVERSTSVTVKGFDPKWRPIKIKAHGLLARAIQHEVAHCNGLLYIDGPHTEFGSVDVQEMSIDDVENVMQEEEE